MDIDGHPIRRHLVVKDLHDLSDVVADEAVDGFDDVAYGDGWNGGHAQVVLAPETGVKREFAERSRMFGAAWLVGYNGDGAMDSYGSR
jgi:hypothetical protein